MERDERRRADALDHYWDAVLRGETPAKPSNVEDEAAAVIAHFGDPFASPQQHMAQERVRARIFSRAKELEDAMRVQTLSLSPPENETLPASSWSMVRLGPHPATTHRRWPAQFATALLLLLTLGFGFLTFRPESSTPERLTNMPAVVAVSTPTAEAALSTVFATTLPEEMVPTAGNLDFLLWNVSLQPNTRGPGSAQDWSCCPGPQIVHVLEGELSVRVEGPLQVFRGSAVASGGGEVLPGTEVALHPGDTAVYSYELPAEYANHGASPVHIVGGGIFAGAVRNIPAVSSHFLDFNEEYSVPALPPGPVDVTLIRATLSPTEEVPAPPAGALVLEVGAAGDADIAQSADGSLRNIGPTESTIYVLTLMPAEAAIASPSS